MSVESRRSGRDSRVHITCLGDAQTPCCAGDFVERRKQATWLGGGLRDVVAHRGGMRERPSRPTPYDNTTSPPTVSSLPHHHYPLR